MKTFRFALTMAVSLAPVIACAQDTWVKHVDDLSFQTHSMWSPRFNLSAGTVMVYGIDATLPKRIESWRAHGYHVAVMTGVSWGEYQDYLDGHYDGKKHWNEAQTDAKGHLGHAWLKPNHPLYLPFRRIWRIPRHRRSSGSGRRRRGYLLGRAGVLGQIRLERELQTRVAVLLQRIVAGPRQLSGRPISCLETEVFSLSQIALASICRG